MRRPLFRSVPVWDLLPFRPERGKPAGAEATEFTLAKLAFMASPPPLKQEPLAESMLSIELRREKAKVRARTDESCSAMRRWRDSCILLALSQELCGRVRYSRHVSTGASSNAESGARRDGGGVLTFVTDVVVADESSLVLTGALDVAAPPPPAAAAPPLVFGGGEYRACRPSGSALDGWDPRPGCLPSAGGTGVSDGGGPVGADDGAWRDAACGDGPTEASRCWSSLWMILNGFMGGSGYTVGGL